MNFPVRLILYNGAMCAAGYALPVFKGFAQTGVWPALVLGYLGLTLGLNRWISHAAQRSPMQFVTAINGSTAVKMLLSLGVATTYLVWVGGEYRVHFVMGLFAAFALNTTLLVIHAQNRGTNT